MFEKPFSFEGRIRRTELWITMGITSVYGFIILGLMGVKPFGSMYFLLIIPSNWFALAQGAKRCHDRDNSGWYQLIPLYAFWMAFAEGDRGSNRFGPDPKSSVHIDQSVVNNNSEIVLEAQSEIASSDIIGKTCPYCMSVIKPDIEIIVCPACNVPHHKECWEANGNKCTTYGCGSVES